MASLGKWMVTPLVKQATGEAVLQEWECGHGNSTSDPTQTFWLY